MLFRCLVSLDAGLLGLYCPGPFYVIPAHSVSWLNQEGTWLVPSLWGHPCKECGFIVLQCDPLHCCWEIKISSDTFNKAYSPLSVFWISALPYDYVATKQYGKLFKQQGQDKVMILQLILQLWAYNLCVGPNCCRCWICLFLKVILLVGYYRDPS